MHSSVASPRHFLSVVPYPTLPTDRLRSPPPADQSERSRLWQRAELLHARRRRRRLLLRLPGLLGRLLWLPPPLEDLEYLELGSQCLDPTVRSEANNDAPRERDSAEANRHAPFFPVDWPDVEGLTTFENDEDLAANHDDVHDEEEIVSLNTLEDVQLVVEPAITLWLLAHV